MWTQQRRVLGMKRFIQQHRAEKDDNWLLPLASWKDSDKVGSLVLSTLIQPTV
jgi:hypothetical protein